MGPSQDICVKRFLAVSRIALGLAPEARPSPDMYVLQRQMPAIRARVGGSTPARARQAALTAHLPPGRPPPV
jgi:hypothetical protein